MTRRKSRRPSCKTPRIRRTLERLEDRTPPSSIAEVLAVAIAFESDPSFLGDLDEDLLDSQSDGERNYLEIALDPSHHVTLARFHGRQEVARRTPDDKFELDPQAATHRQLDATAYQLATDEHMQRHTFPTSAIAYDDAVYQVVAEAQTWNETATGFGAVTHYVSQSVGASDNPFLGEGEGPVDGGDEDTNVGGCVVRLVNPAGPIGAEQGISVPIIKEFRIFAAVKAWGRASIGDGGFSMQVYGWASAYYGPFFNIEEEDITAAVNMVALGQSDGSCRLEYHEVGGSSWDYHSSPLSIGMQANLRHAGDDTITVDFRGTAGARGGGAVGAGIGEIGLVVHIPNTNMQLTKSLRVGTTWRAYPADVAPPPTPDTIPTIVPMESPPAIPPGIPPEIDLNDIPPFPG